MNVMKLDAPIIVMIKAYLNLICILLVCNALHIDTMRKEALDNIKLFPDYNHHFVFFNEKTLSETKPQLQRWSSDTDVKFYINDCKGNKLPQCDTPEQTPILLIFNRIIIRFNGDPSDIQQINDWIQSRIVKSAAVVNDEQKMNQIIQESSNWFCFCINQTTMEGQAMFTALMKTMPFLNFCIINNQEYFTALGLKAGNLTYIKGNATQRVQYEYPTRLDGWQWFVKSNLLHTIPRAQALVHQRFTQKQKNVTVFLITCTYSFKCEKVWENVRLLERQLARQALGFNFSIAIQDEKQSFTFNLYYHLTFDLRKTPAFIYVSLQSEAQKAGKLIRHISYTDENFSIKKLEQFRDKVNGGQFEPFHFSEEIPKKDGFFGKGSQKLIQKLSAKNINQVISSSPNHYIILFSVIDIGCTTCETFYKEYKQIAALLVDKDITFGYFNVNKNEVETQQVTNLPEILLYKKTDKSNPVRMTISHNFQHFRNFIRDSLGDEYFNLDQL